MEATYSKILQKISQPNYFLYQNQHPASDYQIDYSKFWITLSEFQEIKQKFPYFSVSPLMMGILFCKRKQSNKSQWFQSKFFELYQDHLILYSVKNLKRFSQNIL